MQWSSEGVVLGARKHGESSLVLELMTREHGRHLGLLHGGRSKRLASVVQPGNTVHAVWRARLDEYLGTYTVEPAELRSARFLSSPLALYGLASLAALLRLLPERDPHPALFETATILVDHLDQPQVAPALFVRFEVAILSELGFGLDLTSCAATGTRHDLVYVSPRSGRAVSAEAGEPYRDKLLPLPVFLRGKGTEATPSRAEIEAGFQLTEHFLRAHIYPPGGPKLPEERTRFASLALQAARE